MSTKRGRGNVGDPRSGMADGQDIRSHAPVQDDVAVVSWCTTKPHALGGFSSVLLVLLFLTLSISEAGAFISPMLPSTLSKRRCTSSLQCSGVDGWVRISSTANDVVKRAVKLREQARFRREQGAALMVGASPIAELGRSGGGAEGAIRTLFLLEEGGEEWHEDYVSGIQGRVPRVYAVSEAVMKKVAGLESATGRIAAAEVELPKEVSVSKLRRVLIADQIQDPGNLGTILRTASALGWEGAFLLEGCCDPFNEKCIRASRGAAWRMRLQQGGWESLQALFAKDSPELVLVADAGGVPVDSVEQQIKGSGVALWLVLSNEGAGVSREAIAMLKKGAPWRRVAVPMPGDMESLNVAVAGAILIYALR